MLAHLYIGLNELVMRGSEERKNGKWPDLPKTPLARCGSLWGFEYFQRFAPEPNHFLMCRIQMDVSRRAGQGGFHNGGCCPFPAEAG